MWHTGMLTQMSCAGDEGIPTDEMEMAADLYAALQAFFGRYKDLAERPFFITGESYAGHYIPSIGVLSAGIACCIRASCCAV